MGNKKKQSTKMAAIEAHSSAIPSNTNEWTMNQSNIRAADSIEIKQEDDIKSEPVSIGELIDVPTPTYINTTHVPDSIERDGECDVDFLSLDDVKVEAKKECDNKKEKEEPKMNADSGEDAADNQPDQSMLEEIDFMVPECNNRTHNPRKQGGNADENPSKRHKCDYCEYSTDCKGNLDRHVLKHTGEKPHACNLCPKRFTQKRYLQNHMKVHVEEFLFLCSGCFQGFDVEEEKNEHETSCKIRRYECHLCKDSFASMKANMMSHMRVHSGNKPFECKECFKQFTEKSNLHRHMKLHAGPRSFRCSNCRLGFSHQEERNSHEEKCNRPVFECDICGKSFGLCKFNLINHMRIHSGETPFKCQHCLKQFTQKSNLNKHMATHTKKLPFKCLICHHGVLSDSKRKAHQRNCHVRCYECYLCNKFFHSSNADLSNHMRIHSGERPFQCELCHNKFTRKSNLKKHLKNVHHEE